MNFSIHRFSVILVGETRLHMKYFSILLVLCALSANAKNSDGSYPGEDCQPNTCDYNDQLGSYTLTKWSIVSDDDDCGPGCEPNLYCVAKITNEPCSFPIAGTPQCPPGESFGVGGCEFRDSHK